MGARAFAPPAAVPVRAGLIRHQQHHICWSSIASSQAEDESQPTFTELYEGTIPSWLLSRAEALGYKRPTMVQKEALGAVLDGQDVVIQAQTGTGKTLAFMLPLLASIDTKKKAVQALVVVPSRELGLQVASVAKQLAAGRVYYQDEELDEDDHEDQDKETGINEEGGGGSKGQPQQQQGGGGGGGGGKILIMSLLEGSKNRRQRAWAIAEPPHVIIGNPVALSGLVEHRGVRYHQVKMVVIDEVDACLIRRETRAELQALLGKYLSPSYLTAELEEEAALDMSGNRRSFDDEDYELPQGVMKESSGGKERTAETALAPWKLVHRQTIFASATIPQHNHFIRQCVQQQWTLNQPVHIQVTPGELMPPQLKHNYLVCPSKAHKISALRSLLKREAPRGMKACAIFTADDYEAQEIAEKIEDLVVELSNDSSSQRAEDQGEGGGGGLQALISRDHIKRRASIMEKFRSSASRVLVTTDFAARGLDIPQISHVVMYDIPTDADTYLHRGGRAGRMGRPGTVTSLVSETEEFALLRLANSLKIELKRLGVLKAGGGGKASSSR